MDKVNTKTHESGVMFLNGDSVIFENGPNYGNDIIQQALNNISPISEKSYLTDFIENDGLFLKKSKSSCPEETSNLINLSFQEGSDLGMGLTLEDHKISQADSPNQTFNAQDGDFNNLFVSPVTGKDHKFTCIPNIIDGKLTYQIQIPELTPPTVKQSEPSAPVLTLFTSTDNPEGYRLTNQEAGNLQKGANGSILKLAKNTPKFKLADNQKVVLVSPQNPVQIAQKKQAKPIFTTIASNNDSLLSTINAPISLLNATSSNKNGIFVIKQTPNTVPNIAQGFKIGNNVLKNIVVNSPKNITLGTTNNTVQNGIILSNGNVINNGIILKNRCAVVSSDKNIGNKNGQSSSDNTDILLAKSDKPLIKNQSFIIKDAGLLNSMALNTGKPNCDNGIILKCNSKQINLGLTPQKIKVVNSNGITKLAQIVPNTANNKKKSPVKPITPSVDKQTKTTGSVDKSSPKKPSTKPLFVMTTKKQESVLIQPQSTQHENQNTNPNTESPSSLAALAEKIVPITKNPIGKLTDSQLKRIAAVLGQNKSSSSALVDNGDNSKILCRILYPEDFKPGSEKKVMLKSKKKFLAKKKRSNTEKVTDDKNEQSSPEIVKTRRTRSGRLARPPVHITKLYRKSNGNSCQPEENDENTPAPILLPGLPSEKRQVTISQHFRCRTCNKLYLNRANRANHLKKYPDHFLDCDIISTNSTAKKNASQKRSPLHLKQLIEKYNEKEIVGATGSIVAKNISLWDFILLRLENTENNGKSKVAYLLEELEKVVQEVRTVSHKILNHSDASELVETVQVKDDLMGLMLGLKPGFYVPNDEGLTTTQPEKRPYPDSENEEKLNHKRMKPDILMTEDINSDPVKDLSDPALLQDIYINQSDLESVDQIVKERLQSLAPGEDIIVPGLGTDDDIMEGLLTSVEPLSDSILFPTPVSEATEDLYKTLENLADEIQPTTQLDFTDLSNEFNNSGTIMKL